MTQKTFVGPKLRLLRRQHNHTQADMASRLGVSAAYINLLENNQRSLSVKMLLAISEAYNIEAKSLALSTEVVQLGDLRTILEDPLFLDPKPDLPELRAALDHSPLLADQFQQLYRNYQSLAGQIRSGFPVSQNQYIPARPEQELFEFFSGRLNHFETLEYAAEDIRQRIAGAQDDLYALLKRHLRLQHNISCEVLSLSEMPETLRAFDKDAQRVYLSEALDQPNKIFQLAHVIAQIDCNMVVEELLPASSELTPSVRSRLKTELFNYVAAAILMPYEPFLKLARTTLYDIDRLAAAFGVTFEQICHRLTTLQGSRGRAIPFFFIRVDRAGNITKRYNATDSQLGNHGGGCSVWNIYSAFQTPSLTISQFVELDNGKRYFTIARTSDRPVFSRDTQDRRMAVALGCEAEFAEAIIYARSFNTHDRSLYAEIGINCHICSRQKCTQRAHQPVHMDLNLNEYRHGATRYES